MHLHPFLRPSIFYLGNWVPTGFLCPLEVFSQTWLNPEPSCDSTHSCVFLAHASLCLWASVSSSALVSLTCILSATLFPTQFPRETESHHQMGFCEDSKSHSLTYVIFPQLYWCHPSFIFFLTRVSKFYPHRGSCGTSPHFIPWQLAQINTAYFLRLPVNKRFVPLHSLQLGCKYIQSYLGLWLCHYWTISY